jgi:gliding motility-associated-like protein
MKKLLTFLLLLGGLAASASHLAGGDIQYKYIGDSTGIPRHYKVILRVYRDITGIGMPAVETVTISSGCYPNINLTVNLTAGSGIVSPTLFDCVNPGPNVKTLEVYRYIGYVVLPGNCPTYRFWYSNCCRPPGVTNISNSNGNGLDGFYFDAELNNTLGQNSSPIFVSEPVRAFCVANPFNWKQSSVEYDGDSINYTLINCREGAYPNQTNIPFNPGFTANQPVSSTYFNINTKTGQISFYPTTQEIDALSVLIEEYRYDSTWGTWIKVGTSSRDMMISIADNCNSVAMQGVQYNPTQFPIDPVVMLPYKEINCWDSAFGIKFHIALDGYSINDADFRMTRVQTGQPVAIKKIWSNVNVDYETDSVRVVMFTPFSYAGDYYLYSKKGNDGNTLVNKCGIEMDEFDTLLIRVGPCPPPPPPGEFELPEDRYGPDLPPLPPIQPIIIPNVITPNGDNKNDLFVIKNLEQWENPVLHILNRWGQVVYYDENYNNDWNGSKLADGVYYGILQVSKGTVVKSYSFTLTILDNE